MMSILLRGLLCQIFYLSETGSDKEGKPHLPELSHTLTGHLISSGILKKHIVPIILTREETMCIFFFRILPAIKSSNMKLALLQDDRSFYSHKVNHLTSEHDGTVLPQCVDLA